MPFRNPALSLRDILDAIDMIVQFVRGMDLEAFREDPKTVAAVERKLLLISEAAMRLGEDAERLCPGLPWHNIRGIGNWLRCLSGVAVARGDYERARPLFEESVAILRTLGDSLSISLTVAHLALDWFERAA